MYCNKCGSLIKDGETGCVECKNSKNKNIDLGKSRDNVKVISQEFVDDVKGVIDDKDARGFLRKKNYRNTKIIALIILVLIFISKLFGGSSSAERAIKEEYQNKYNSIKINAVYKIHDDDVWDDYEVKAKIDGKECKGIASYCSDGDIVSVSNMFFEEDYDTYKTFKESYIHR